VNEPNKEKCFPIYNNLHFRMEIINKRGEINLNKWMEKAKDYRGLIKCGYRCAPNVEHDYAMHADGGGVGFRVNSKHLQEVKASTLIVCSSYNVS